MESFQKKAWSIACQTHPHAHCHQLFHTGHKDSPQSRSESTGISQCDFDLPQAWFASPVGVTCSVSLRVLLEGHGLVLASPAVLLCDVTGQWV